MRYRAFFLSPVISRLAIWTAPRHQLPPVAPGGFGRRQLAPASDLDVLFFLLEQTKERERAEEMLAFAIPALWDLGFSLDHLSPRQSDCRELGASDSKLLSSILDARLVWGSQALYRQFLDTRDALIACTGSLRPDGIGLSDYADLWRSSRPRRTACPIWLRLSPMS
jgi:UTP:GlnB (protein PII) uridylyltransferase